MKHITMLWLIILLITPLMLGAVLPACYHTYEQITTMLQGFAQDYPDIAKLHMIGYSQQDNIPIYALQISDNVAVNDDEDEPALLFVGQVHAEEVLGVEITLSNINEILSSRYQMPYAQWISQLDLWFIPTANPEGHNVVTSNTDLSYRKNKRDNNLNGIFDYDTSQPGYDIDGVDINRNFRFNWVHGDTLMQPGGDEVYDYYAGEAPFSESETRAIKTLCDQKKFIYSIVWHSSRTGRFSEKVYYSYNWKEVRPSPDMNFAASIGNAVAAQIEKEAGGGTYDVYPNLSRKGAFHDWLYQQYGTIQLLIECGTRNLQPDSLIMAGTIQRCSNGVRWLINRAMFFSTEVTSSSMLTGKVSDAVTTLPLEAEIIIQQHSAPWFEPRRTKPATGRYYRPLTTGSYTVQAKKKGYFDSIIPSVQVYNNNWTQRNITLQPKLPAVLSAAVRNGGQDLSARVIIGSYEPDTLYVNGGFVFNGYEGEYPIQIYADGYYPFLGTLNLHAGENTNLYNLSPATVVFSETWESGTSAWEIEGPWVRQNELAASGYAITDSWGGKGFYDLNCNVWIKTSNPITLPAGSAPYLVFDSHLYTEWNFDPATVEVSSDGTEWQVLWTKSGQWDKWRKEFVPLSQYAGQSVYLRFHLTDSSTDRELTDPGWTIDNIAIITGSSTPTTDELNPSLPACALYPNFPNPFNPETTISFSLAKATPTILRIYNLKGQLVRNLLAKDMPKGDHKIVWNGLDNNGMPTGSSIYLYRLEAGDYTRSLKMVLMK
ncbi:MAG: M14 family zinc carboxypeptidase [Candidatus Cloacimonetes bacterium]|nr:M14 family zinc carboxypeptidase [Candidatus Cloacimonadota bacterium]